MWTNYLGCDVHLKKFSNKCFPITVTAVVFWLYCRDWNERVVKPVAYNLCWQKYDWW